MLNVRSAALSERLSKMFCAEERALEILQENITLRQKKLTSKDEIIKTLIETQTSILESVSYQRLKIKSNELVNQLELAHQSSNKMNSSKSPSSPHLLNVTPNCYENINTNASEANKNSILIHLNLKMTKVKLEIKKKRLWEI